MITQARKYLKIGPYGLMAGCVLVIALCIRIVLIRMGWPATNSDEATMGLMARHIAYSGEHPIFIYGQNYMGSLEAHIGAALFFIFGPSLFSLRLSLVFLYALFLVSLYLLTSLLYSKKFALAIIVLCSVGSVELLTRQLKAVGGAVETMLFGCLLILFSSWLVLSYQKGTPTVGRRKHWFLYWCFGLAMGLGMWSHLLILPFVATSLTFLVFFCYREMRLPVLVFFVLGLLLGFLPSLIFDIQHPMLHPLNVLLQLHSTGGTTASIPFTLWDQIRGTVLISLPVATGANPQCLVADTPGLWRTHITSCLLVQGVWGLSFLLLYSFVLLLTIHALAKYILQRRITTPSDEERRAMLYDAARLTLLLSGGLTLLAYLLSPAPALVPLTSTRYLVGLVVMFPVLLAPLWKSANQLYAAIWSCRDRCIASKDGDGGQHVRAKNRRRHVAPPHPLDAIHRSLRGLDVGKGGLFLFIYLMYFIGIIGVFQQVPALQAANQQQDKMVNDLIRMHATHIYSDYWTCDRVIFQSNERIICSVLDEQLRTGDNRYLPYQSIVEHDAQSVYVFQASSPQALALARRSTQTGQFYERVEIDNYVLFKPAMSH